MPPSCSARVRLLSGRIKEMRFIPPRINSGGFPTDGSHGASPSCSASCNTPTLRSLLPGRRLEGSASAPGQAKPSALAVLLAGTALCADVAMAGDEHIFCIEADIQGVSRYYSAIFLEDYSNADSLKLDFHEYLEKQGVEASYLHAWCFFERSYPAAEREYARHVRSDEDAYRIVRTNWAPESFGSQPLRDFNITVSSSRREVRVCVRDHECEDGDKVRVSVNGGRVFSGEIDNDWVCDDIPVHEGNNRIELFAVNGSGRKGNCSYADVNTGEIRVEGRNNETQSWRHRGGAGSKANIIVKVR